MATIRPTVGTNWTAVSSGAVEPGQPHQAAGEHAQLGPEEQLEAADGAAQQPLRAARRAAALSRWASPPRPAS